MAHAASRTVHEGENVKQLQWRHRETATVRYSDKKVLTQGDDKTVRYEENEITRQEDTEAVIRETQESRL